MRLNEILTEDKNLQEGPLLNKIGTGIGNVVGGVGKAAGAVAGGIAGLGSAFKKGFQAGKTTVAGAGDKPADSAAAPAADGSSAGNSGTTSGGAQTQTLANPKDPNTGKPTAAPATGAAQQDTTATAPAKSNTPFGRLAQAAAGQDPDAAEPAKAEPAADADAQAQAPAAGGGSQTGTAKAAAPTAGAADSQGRVEPTLAAAQTQNVAQDKPDAANETEYARAQKSIAGLQPEQQKELLAALMADPKVKANLDAAAAKKNPQQQQNQTTTPNTDQTQQTKTADAGAADPTAAQKAGRPSPVTAPATKDIGDEPNIIRGGGGESIQRNKKSLSEASVVPSAQKKADDFKTFSAIQQGFERGRRNPFGSSEVEKPTDALASIKEPTGTVSQDTISKLNSLDKNQRSILVKKLKAKMI